MGPILPKTDNGFLTSQKILGGNSAGVANATPHEVAKANVAATKLIDFSNPSRETGGNSFKNNNSPAIASAESVEHGKVSGDSIELRFQAHFPQKDPKLFNKNNSIFNKPPKQNGINSSSLFTSNAFNEDELKNQEGFEAIA